MCIKALFKFHFIGLFVEIKGGINAILQSYFT